MSAISNFIVVDCEDTSPWEDQLAGTVNGVHKKEREDTNILQSIQDVLAVRSGK
jgi:hypothetical protein